MMYKAFDTDNSFFEATMHPADAVIRALNDASSRRNHPQVSRAYRQLVKLIESHLIGERYFDGRSADELSAAQSTLILHGLRGMGHGRAFQDIQRAAVQLRHSLQHATEDVEVNLPEAEAQAADDVEEAEDDLIYRGDDVFVEAAPEAKLMIVEDVTTEYVEDEEPPQEAYEGDPMFELLDEIEQEMFEQEEYAQRVVRSATDDPKTMQPTNDNSGNFRFSQPPIITHINRVSDGGRVKIGGTHYEYNIAGDDFISMRDGKMDNSSTVVSVSNGGPLDRYDVFISYAREDMKLMQNLRRNLQKAGYTVWTDEGIEPGEKSWQSAIEHAIVHSNAVVVLMSPEAHSSEWVEKELNCAKANNVRMIPMLVRGLEMQSVPFILQGAQYLDSRDKQLLMKSFKRLTQVLARLRHINSSSEA